MTPSTGFDELLRILWLLRSGGIALLLLLLLHLLLLQKLALLHLLHDLLRRAHRTIRGPSRLTLIGLLVLLGTLVSDLMLAWLDPRIRFS